MSDVSLTSMLLKAIVLGFYGAGLFFFFATTLNWLWFVIGLGVGVGLLWADQQWLWRWYADKAQPFVITRMFVFILVLIPLSIFIVTSSGSYLGQGLVLGMILNYTIDLGFSYRSATRFQRQFLAGTTIQLSALQRSWSLVFAVIFVSVLTIMSIV